MALQANAILYISGPMAGLPGHNYEAFFRAERALRDGGYQVLNPAALGPVPGWVWSDYLRRDIMLMLSAGPNLFGIATLPDAPTVLAGASPSEGRAFEIYVGEKFGMVVRSVGMWLNIAKFINDKRDFLEGGPFNHISIDDLNRELGCEALS